MRLILMGAPGAGKGTQAGAISARYGIPTVSMGNMLRKTVADGSDLGVKAKEYMDAGRLVPSDLIRDVIADALASPECEAGFLLDGYPRNLEQADTLDDIDVDIDLLISLEIDDSRIIERMAGRRTCEKCGATYHVLYSPPAKEDTCDADGETLITRVDDMPETVGARLEVYHRETEPLKVFYEQRGKLITIDGDGSISQVTDRINDAFDKYEARHSPREK